jgi:hypothetical protein
MKRNTPKRVKSEQSSQQKTSSQDCVKQTETDALHEKNLQWLEELNAIIVSSHLG